MPWDCCGAALPDSTPRCPACGKGKQRWTLRLNATKRFVLGKQAEDWDIEAVDHTGASEFGPADAPEEDEDWEVEAVDHTGASDAAAPFDLEDVGLSTKSDGTDEDDDWEVEAVDHEGASGPGGGAIEAGGGGISTRETGAGDEDDDWDLEAVEVEGEEKA